MKINDSIIILTILFILYILFTNNKKYKKNKNNNQNNNHNDNSDYDNNNIYYRNSHSVYNDNYINKSKNNKYKEYRYNINNYKIKQKLLKESEYKFYSMLKSSIDINYIICPKVKISNFIQMIDKRSWEDYYEKISNQSIDFLICDNTFKPLFGIILFYGDIQIQTENEKFLKELYAAINLPILKFEITSASNDIIKEKIEHLLKKNIS